MKRAFIEKKLSKKSMEIVEYANQICADYAAQGYDLSLRQLYYQFVSRNLLPNSEASYKNLGNVINDARMLGLLDWEYIKDRGRRTTKHSHWVNPAEIMEATAEQFHIDTWKYQPCHVEVMVEKQALEGILEPVCRDLDISFTANKGYSSVTSMYTIAQRLHGKMYRGDKEAHILYFGDHDPSGMDMTRDVEDRLNLLCPSSASWKASGAPRKRIHVHRLALNMDQIEEYNPPENPAKITDSRSDKYIEEFGNSSWELDALEPRVLAALVTDAVLGYRDVDLHEQAQLQQEQWRDDLRAVAAARDPKERW